LKMKTLWDIASCSLLGLDRRFRGAYCLHHQRDHASFQKALIFRVMYLRFSQMASNLFISAVCAVSTHWPSDLSRLHFMLSHVNWHAFIIFHIFYSSLLCHQMPFLRLPSFLSLCYSLFSFLLTFSYTREVNVGLILQKEKKEKA
jgi:hypothetical protein